jgi:hypothetical protein
MRKVPVRSRRELFARLKADVKDRAGVVSTALAIGVAEEIEAVSQRRVQPDFTTRETKAGVTAALISVPKGLAGQVALAEEVLKTRPFAAVLNRLRSKAELLRVLDKQGIR